MFSPLCVPLQAPVVRGGWRQQIEHDQFREIRPPPLAALSLLLEWGDGLSSALRLAKHMQYAVEDAEVTHPMIHRLGRVASNPTTSAARRSLMALLSQCGFDDLLQEIPGSLVNHVVLPSSLLRFLCDRFPEAFRRFLGADERRLKDFWQSFRLHPDVDAHICSHPALKTCDSQIWKRVVPLTIHEDAGPFSKKKSC